MIPDIVRRYGAPVPRYTSYPTANHFTPAVGHRERKAWLASLPAGVRLSLYLHIPFCRSLCWYCACSTKMTRRHEPVARYLAALADEVRDVAQRLPARHTVSHIHWGGGSPSLLMPADIRRLGLVLGSQFALAAITEHAVEIDPRDATAELADAFAAIGVNRISLGVQDFDPSVQKAINRIQSFETTRHAVAMFRARGITSINIDLVYGLPFQTRRSLDATMRQVLELDPDRLAIFGYAHLPARVAPQRLIPAEALPGLAERYWQAGRLARLARRAGYRQVGIDHFARATDALGHAPLRRNFQGYTTDRADALIGLGASAISQLPQGFVQNTVPVHDYQRRIAEHGQAAARGIALTDDDRIRGHVIERLMCDFSFSAGDLRARFGPRAEPVIAEARQLLAGHADRLLAATADGFALTRRGRAFARSIAATFDAHLARSTATHAVAV